jgi:hypothetical protein
VPFIQIIDDISADGEEELLNVKAFLCRYLFITTKGMLFYKLFCFLHAHITVVFNVKFVPDQVDFYVVMTVFTHFG